MTPRVFIVMLVLVAVAAAQTVDLPVWTSPAGPGDGFSFKGAPEPPARVSWRVPGVPRKYFSELLPALFERTLEIEEFEGEGSRLEWIFTGPSGGVTVEVTPSRARLTQRYYDSFGLRKAAPAQERSTRHPEGLWEASMVPYRGTLRAITVRMDHRLGIRVLLNGREVLEQRCLFDLNRHQLAFAGAAGGARGRLLPTAPEQATVTVNAAARRQRMLGFGGIAIANAYVMLSAEGKRAWWRKLVEYNLLLHREYPIGARLNRKMTNWDRLEDSVPHYYGDNFANGEISDFEYLQEVRRIGGKVIFEFWQLPPWAKRDWRDGGGELHEGVADIEPYTRAMVRYCRISKEKVGAPPEIVGIQNEVTQPAPVWRQMALGLRQALDQAGFGGVKIHMQNAGRLEAGIESAKAFVEDPAVWKTIDYAASNMYDYQRHFFDPDKFDPLLRQFKQITGGKQFLSTEISINSDEFQGRSYRIALAMAQLYHKNLTLADAVGILYCWTLLNVEQPSYGWTRSLMVPGAEHNFMPVAPSHQLRVFGAYSRRIREGMTRLEASSTNADVLVTAFEGAGGGRTLVLLNRSMAPRSVVVHWPGKPFRYLETASPSEENMVRAAPVARKDGACEVRIEPGAIATLSNMELGHLAN
jgi:O-glycosyl hydrolase